MTKSDIQRIEEAVEKRYTFTDGNGATGFKAGAQYEHPIAYNQGVDDAFNELSKSAGLTGVILTDVVQLKGILEAIKSKRLKK